MFFSVVVVTNHSLFLRSSFDGQKRFVHQCLINCAAVTKAAAVNALASKTIKNVKSSTLSTTDGYLKLEVADSTDDEGTVTFI